MTFIACKQAHLESRARAAKQSDMAGKSLVKRRQESESARVCLDLCIFFIFCFLAYGWGAGNLNRPIRIKQTGKTLLSRKSTEIRQLLLLKMALNMHLKRFTVSKTIPDCKKGKI